MQYLRTITIIFNIAILGLFASWTLESIAGQFLIPLVFYSLHVIFLIFNLYYLSAHPGLDRNEQSARPIFKWMRVILTVVTVIALLIHVVRGPEVLAFYEIMSYGEYYAIFIFLALNIVYFATLNPKLGDRGEKDDQDNRVAVPAHLAKKTQQFIARAKGRKK